MNLWMQRFVLVADFSADWASKHLNEKLKHQ